MSQLICNIHVYNDLSKRPLKLGSDLSGFVIAFWTYHRPDTNKGVSRGYNDQHF